MRCFIETYGCQMNAAESAALKDILLQAGWEAAENPADASLVILNTCAVRETAEERFLARLAIYAAQKKTRSSSKMPLFIACAGCAAEKLGASLLEKGADFVLGAHSAPRLSVLLASWDECTAQKGIFTEKSAENIVFFGKNHHEKGEYSAFLPIMNGCNNFCSYCIVPYLRGREVSRPPDEIIAEIERLAEDNVREITLLGQNVNAYNYENTDFSRLIRLIARKLEGSSIKWARFLSSHPKDMTDAIIEALAESPLFCRHIHLPFQNGSDRILAAMNRRTTRSSAMALIGNLRRALPDVTLSTDILIGFPGETEADVEETLDFMEEARFLHAFMYHYNPREGTAAAKLPGRIEHAVKIERLSRVINAQTARTKALMAEKVGKNAVVLVGKASRRSSEELLCKTEHEESVVIDAKGAKTGDFLDVRLNALNGTTFVGCR